MNKIKYAVGLCACIFLGACASAPENAGMVKTLRLQYDQLAANPKTIEIAPAALLDAERALERAETLVKNGQSAERVELQLDAVKQNLALVETKLTAANSPKPDAIAPKYSGVQTPAKSTKQTRADELATYMAIKAEEFQERTSGVSSKLVERGLVLTLEDALFEMGKTKLTSDSAKSLEVVSDFLANFPDQKVSVEGHTDAVGEEDFNQRISERRASSVKSALANYGTDPERINVKGFGESAPVATNRTPEGRQKNRRVEIVVEIPRT